MTLIALLLGSAAVPTLRRLQIDLDDIRALRGRPWNQRRTHVLGPYYRDVRALRRQIPENASVAIIPKDGVDGDIAVHSIYHLYPRSIVLYRSRDAFEQNIRDGEATPSKLPPPRWVIDVDHRRDPVLQLIVRPGDAR